MKKYICLIAGLLCLVAFVACGLGATPMPPADVFTGTTETTTETETASEPIALEETEAATETAAAQQLSVAATSAATARSSASATAPRATTTAAAKVIPPAPAASTTCTTTTKPTTQPPPAPTAAPTSPPAPVYTQADYEEIVRIIRNYAESKTNARFVWDTSLTREKADQGRAGYHGTPNITRHSKKSVIDDLMYHVDLTAENVARSATANGMEPIVNYHVYWYVDTQGTWGFGPNDICFILVYG